MPPVDHECSLLGFVTELADRLAKLEHENAQLKKSLFGKRSERSKLPRVKTAEPPTAAQVAETRRTRAEAKTQTPTLRVEHKVPAGLRRCTACGRTYLAPMGSGKTTRARSPALPLRRLHRHRAGRAEGRREGAVRRKLPRGA